MRRLVSKVGLAAAATILSSFAGYAADIRAAPVSRAAPLVAPASNWTGFYVGINGGWGWGDGDHTATAGSSAFTIPFSTGGGMPGTQTNVDINGGVFGGHVGFNWQFSNWVIGLEASAAWTDIKGSTTASLAFPGVAGLATETFNTKLNWQATATPRLGLVWNDWLFYAKGGLAAGGVDMSSIRVSGTGGSFAATQQRVGWTVGAGIEWAYARNWVFGIEWDFVDLGTQNFAGFGTETTGASRFFGEDVRLRYNEVLGRLSYKFDEIR